MEVCFDWIEIHHLPFFALIVVIWLCVSMESRLLSGEVDERREISSNWRTVRQNYDANGQAERVEL